MGKKVQAEQNHLSERLSQVSLLSSRSQSEEEDEPQEATSLSDAEDFIMRGGRGSSVSTEEVTSASLPSDHENNEITGILSQELFESQDYVTPNEEAVAMEFDSRKENVICPTPIKVTVARIKRHKPEGLLNQSCQNIQACFDQLARLKEGSGSDDFRIPTEISTAQKNNQLAAVGEGIGSDNFSPLTKTSSERRNCELRTLRESSGLDDFRTPIETPSKRKNYVSKSALVLRARVMSPPCIKNPYVPEDEELNDKLQKSTRRSPASGVLVDNRSSMSRYRADFHELQEIGRGNFSRVFKVLHRIDGCCYAVKRSAHKLELESEKEEALLEVQALAALGHHKNIVGYRTAWFENDLLYIQMELCDYSLANALEKGALKSHVDFLDAMYQIAQALEFIHDHGVVHLDLKPENIYVCGGTYKLGDFGRARLLNGTLQIEEGDARYLPREIMNGNYEHLDKADMYSLGAMFYELVKRKQTPDSGRPLDRSKEIKIPVLPGFSVYFQKLLQALVDTNPMKRPSAKDLLRNPVFEKVRRLKEI